MSTIDLDRLIARQKYFIPIKSSQLKNAICNEFNATNPPIFGIYPWGIGQEHKLGLSFHGFKYSFIFDATWTMDLTTEECKKLVEEKSKEFEKMGPDAFFNTLKNIRPDVPAEIYVSVINEEENGCLRKVECLPILYKKIRSLKEFKTDDLKCKMLI